MRAVFLDRATIDATIDLSPIEQQLSELKCYASTTAEQVVSRAKGFEIIITNKVVLDKSLINQLPDLKLICVAATGTNNIDHEAAGFAGIAVKNVADYSTTSVAQHLFAYLLDYFSKVTQYQIQNQKNQWADSKLFCQFHAPVNELAGKSIGIIGYGNIGETVASIARAFGMQVLIAERNNAPVIREGRIAFNDLLATADVVTLHCPLTKETEKMIGKESLKLMKNDSVLINTSRGPVVDTFALANALKQGNIAHAIIDVLEQEPPSDNHPLLDQSIKNITLTHHIAWGSLQAQQKLIEGIAKNIQTLD